MTYSEYQPGQSQRCDAELVQLFVKTFGDSEGPEEGALIGKLVRDFLDTTDYGDLRIIVAVEDAALEGSIFVGSIVFSRFTCGDGTGAFLMAPVAVYTDYQKRGIGQELIRYGLEKLRASGVQLVMSYGDINFYSKTGFVVVSEELIPAPLPLSYPTGWIGQSLDGETIKPVTGGTQCVPAIEKSVYW